MTSVQQPPLRHISNENDRSSITDLSNILPISIYTCDIYGYITSYNQAAVDLWGRTPDIGRDLWCGSWKIFYPTGEPMPLDECPMARVLKTGLAIAGEHIVIQRPDGRKILAKVYPKPLFDDDGALAGAVNTLIDVSEQQAEAEQNSALAAIIEYADVPIISKTIDGMITTWNRAAEQLLGYTKEEVIGEPITILFPQNRLNEENIIIGRIRRGQRIERYETIRVSKYGKEIPVYLTISPIKNTGGQIIGASKIMIDITRQKENERKLQRYTENVEILNTISKLVSESLDIETILQKVTDASTQIIGAQFGAFFYNKVNKDGESYRLFTLSGAPREAFEKFGMPRNTAVFHPTFTGEGPVRVDDITQDPRYGHNAPHHGMPKGHLPVVSYLAVPVVSESGGVIGGLFFGHPEPAKFTQEHENLVQSIARQASVALQNAKLYAEVRKLNKKKDEFIGLASHELKTPVTSLKGYLQILENRLVNDAKNQSFIDKAVHQVNKLSDLIADLLDVSKIETGQLPLSFSSFDLITVIRDAVELHQYATRTHKIFLACQLESLPVIADQQRIEQVINNLISNAIKYSPGANKVDITIRESDKDVQVEVSDYGMGISKEQQERIFSRFYRVDEMAAHISGLGIGLYISKEIITRHNGTLTVESEPGHGSTFTFEIPVSQDMQPSAG
jgi:PAS domain S-box-containing protein